MLRVSTVNAKYVYVKDVSTVYAKGLYSLRQWSLVCMLKVSTLYTVGIYSPL